MREVSVEATMGVRCAQQIGTTNVKSFANDMALRAFLRDNPGWSEIPYTQYSDLWVRGLETHEIISQLEELKAPSPALALLLEAVRRMLREARDEKIASD